MFFIPTGKIVYFLSLVRFIFPDLYLMFSNINVCLFSMHYRVLFSNRKCPKLMISRSLTCIPSPKWMTVVCNASCITFVFFSVCFFIVMHHPYHFLGNSLLSWDFKNEVKISIPWFLGLMFRTRHTEAMLVQAHAGQYTTIVCQV